ncbi:hypothetical protein B0H14DRAFT_302068 [Mycena olivaceomarginata]|nr:hypothetical protein B0H14DRAFT_302068 [Mycena olivaceomarginata]
MDRLAELHTNLCNSSTIRLFCISFTHTLRGSLKPNNKSGMVCAYPASMGISAFSVRICPPRSHRRIFTQPPPEILSAIFGCAIENKYGSWRPTLISFALVCRDWEIALEHLFHDFGSDTSGKTAPDLKAVSEAVLAKPQLGKAIWHLSRSHFGRDQNQNEPEYLDLAIAFKNVLHSAKHVRDLEILHTHSSIREEFVEALGQSRDVRTFLIDSHSTPDEPNYRCRPTLPELFRCFQKWSRLHGLKLFGWDGPNPFLQTAEQFTIEQTPPLGCALRSITLYNGPITAPQLCNLTAGSHSSLSDVSFNGIVGLSNAGLKGWLLQVAPALRQLNIEKSSIAKASDDEEYALDATMSHLISLSSMRIEGDVLSELAVSRKPGSTGRSGGGRINLANCPGVNPNGLVQALKYTGWSIISTQGLFEGNKPLREEGKAIAKERGLYFL